MLVHFIGGPLHGESKVVEVGHSIIRVPIIKGEPRVVRDWYDPSPIGPSYEEREYRVTRRTERYCVAEFQELPVDVKVSVDFGAHDFWDNEVNAVLGKFAMDEHDRPADFRREKLRCTAAHYGTGAFTMEWLVQVDGPADGHAVAAATKRVQERLEAKLPYKARRDLRVSAAVS